MAEAVLQNHIHAVLAAADDSLKFREIVDALAEAGIAADEQRVRNALREGEITGRFVRGEIGGCVVYTNNPFSEPGRATRSKNAVWAEIAHVLRAHAAPLFSTTLFQRVGARCGAGEAWIKKVAHAAAKDGRLVRTGGARNSCYALPEFAARPDDAAANTQRSPVEQHVATTGTSIAPASETAAVDDAQPPRIVRSQLGLRDRLEAVVTDIEDAIGDACDAQVQHDVIKALTLANGATQRALRHLAER